MWRGQLPHRCILIDYFTWVIPKVMSNIFFVCKPGTADEGEYGGRWTHLLCYLECLVTSKLLLMTFGMTLVTTATSARSNNALPDYGDYTETCWSCFNVNFNVNFKIVFKTIQLCISWWIKNFDSIIMHGMCVEVKCINILTKWSKRILCLGIVWKLRKYCTESRRNKIFCTQ
jgi:hypothetical protein